MSCLQSSTISTDSKKKKKKKHLGTLIRLKNIFFPICVN